MRLAKSGEYDPHAVRIDRDAACPKCHARSQVFQDGAVLCVVENLSFVPEESDVELFRLQTAHRAGAADRGAAGARATADRAASDLAEAKRRRKKRRDRRYPYLP